MDVAVIVIQVILVLSVAHGFYLMGRRHEKAHQKDVLHSLFFRARTTLETCTKASHSMLHAAALNFRQTMHLAKAAEDEQRYYLARNWNHDVETIMRMMKTNGYVSKGE